VEPTQRQQGQVPVRRGLHGTTSVDHGFDTGEDRALQDSGRQDPAPAAPLAGGVDA
jgi:hypothetical protein